MRIFNRSNKGFTLIELLVVIAVLGLLASIVMISITGTQDKAYEARGQSNQRQAKLYCSINPGESELNGYTVYCDKYNNMWAETLNTGLNTKYGSGTLNATPDSETDRWYWSHPDYGNLDVVSLYGINDCNAVPAEDLHKFPACNACATLNYAGFSEGWRLPSQGTRPPLFNANCDADCARDDVYCAPGRQLWDFGAEQCSNWGATDCAFGQGSCVPGWDDYAISRGYWASSQSGASLAWRVDFTDASVLTGTKSAGLLRARCFLGQWP